MPLRFEKEILVDEDGAIAVDLIAANTELSKQKIKDAMQKGCVWQSRGKKTLRLRRAKKELRKGETLFIYYDENVLSMLAKEPLLIMDEGEYSVWNKPCGLLSQGSKWGDHCTITRWAEQHLKPQRPSFVIHRLDRAAQGLILVGHSKKAAAALSQMFATREVEKVYQAIVEGQWPEPSTTICHDIDKKAAISHVSLLSYDPLCCRTRVEVRIETGRKHQIRKHLSMEGFPIVGDRLYGSVATDENLNLAAVELTFRCPISRQSRAYQITPEF